MNPLFIPLAAWTICMIHAARMGGAAIDFWTGGPIIRYWVGIWMSTLDSRES